MANNEGITLMDTAKLVKLGSFRNEWRQRTVILLEHATDPLKVVSVGVPFGDGESIVCSEPRSAYVRQLEHGNWGTEE